MPTNVFTYTTGVMLGDQATNGVNPITSDDLDLLASYGCTYVRLGVAPNIAFTDNTFTSWNASALSYINNIMDMCAAKGISLILDNHPHTDGSNYSNAVTNINQILSMWISAFGNRGKYVAFEILNEPQMTDATVWKNFHQPALTYLRQNDPLGANRIVFIGGLYTGYHTGLGPLSPLVLNGTTTKDPNVVYTVHFYEPFPFTHQGTIDYSQFTGVRYPTDHTYVNNQFVARGLSGGGNTRTTDYDRRQILIELNKPVTWGKNNGVPVHIGEFGIYRDNQTNYPVDSFEWFTDVIFVLNQLNLPYNIFVYKGTVFPINNQILSLMLGVLALANNIQTQVKADGSTALIATDEITTRNGATVPAEQAQRMKPGWGAPGQFNDVTPSTPFPVQLSVSNTAVGPSNRLPVDHYPKGALLSRTNGFPTESIGVPTLSYRFDSTTTPISNTPVKISTLTDRKYQFTKMDSTNTARVYLKWVVAGAAAPTADKNGQDYPANGLCAPESAIPNGDIWAYTLDSGATAALTHQEG